VLDDGVAASPARHRVRQRRNRQLRRAEDLTEQTWQDMLDVNLTGVWQHGEGRHPPSAGGRRRLDIITSSGAGLKGQANTGHYVAAKHGVVGLMKTLANELAPDLIRVNTVNPGSVDTR